MGQQLTQNVLRVSFDDHKIITDPENDKHEGDRGVWKDYVQIEREHRVANCDERAPNYSKRETEDCEGHHELEPHRAYAVV